MARAVTIQSPEPTFTLDLTLEQTKAIYAVLTDAAVAGTEHHSLRSIRSELYTMGFQTHQPCSNLEPGAKFTPRRAY